MHQFKPGREVYLRPYHCPPTQATPDVRNNYDASFKVIEQIWHKGWPHYILVAPDGSEWKASQSELMSQPFRYDKHFVVQRLSRQRRYVFQ